MLAIILGGTMIVFLEWSVIHFTSQVRELRTAAFSFFLCSLPSLKYFSSRFMSFFFLSFTERFFSISHFFFPPAFLLSDIFIPSVSVQVWSQAFLYCPVLHPSSLSTSINAVLCSPLLFCPSLTSATFSFFFFFCLCCMSFTHTPIYSYL